MWTCEPRKISRCREGGFTCREWIRSQKFGKNEWESTSNLRHPASAPRSFDRRWHSHLTREVWFYKRLNSDPLFASLRPHVPKFCGTLRFDAWKGARGCPCVCDSDISDSTGESCEQVLEAQYIQPRNAALKRSSKRGEEITYDLCGQNHDTPSDRRNVDAIRQTFR